MSWCELVFSSGIISGQVHFMSESAIIYLVVPVYPLVLGRAVEWERSKVVVRFQVRVHEFANNGGLGGFDLLDYGHVFIILFEAGNPIVDSG